MAPIAPTCIDPTAPIDPKLLEVAIQMVEREKGRALTADEQTSVQQQVRVDFLHQCTSDCRLIVYKLDKWLVALQMIRLYPEKWFRRRQVDDRDQALINSDPTPAVPVGPKSSYLRNMYHKKLVDAHFDRAGHHPLPSLLLSTVCTDTARPQTQWIVETEEDCRRMIRQAGSDFHGFSDLPAITPRPQWQSMKVNISVTGRPAPGITNGTLSTMPSKIRVLAGPSTSGICPWHQWDAMILRDCYVSVAAARTGQTIPTHQCHGHGSLGRGSPMYDVLLIKMCEDYDHPWVVAAARESGPYVAPGGCYAL